MSSQKSHDSSVGPGSFYCLKDVKLAIHSEVVFKKLLNQFEDISYRKLATPKTGMLAFQ
jgi:hypothetical protein